MACKLRLDVQDYLGPFQYAYSQGRGTDDAVNIVVHLILKHLDKPKARLLFVDFSSVFNLIQPHTLLSKLKQLNVSLQETIICACIEDELPKARKRGIKPDNPRNIAPNIATVPAPPISELVARHRTRFTKTKPCR